MGTVSAIQPEPDTEPSFDDFWLLYPRRIARMQAQKEWDHLSADDKMLAIVALATWRRIWIKRDEMDYVPHASTWLHQERWGDELPTDGRGVSNASHAPAQIPAKGERSAMPEHVRLLLAKLRSKP